MVREIKDLCEMSGEVRVKVYIGCSDCSVVSSNMPIHIPIWVHSLPSLELLVNNAGNAA